MSQKPAWYGCAYFVFFVLFSWGMSQAQEPDGPPPDAHHEVLDDPPAAPEDLPTQRSPALRWTRNGYVSVQVNVDANGDNIVGDAANEPSIAVDPTDSMHKVIGWRQFDSITSNFRQAGYGYTTDGGETWTFPGVIDPGVFRSDPVLDFDADGNFYYNSLTNVGGYWCNVYRSFDGGATWDNGTYAEGGDKQWMCIDRSGGLGHGNIYSAWNLFFSICSGDFTGSRDGGDSFFSCINIPDAPRWGTMMVGPDGEVYVAGEGAQIAKSTTLQDPGIAPQFDFSANVNLGGSTISSSGPNPGGLLGQVYVGVDASDGPTRGNVYLCASVDPSGSDPMDVMFARSTDGGQTWSSPVRINDDPAGNGAWQWFATMSVAPNGRIDVVWNDTRANPGTYLSELYYSYSEDAGTTWAPNVAVSPSFDPHLGWPDQNKIGDYYEMISDELGADVAYSATFNGEQDVYYLRIGDSVSETGSVFLDQDHYACESSAGIRVLDSGLNTDPLTAENVTVSIDSDTETGVEQVVLIESAPNAARFEGTIALSETNAVGVLAIAPGDTVTVTYIDADDGQGHFNVVVTDTATVDCTAPMISNVQTPDVGPFQATVTFDTNEPCLGAVRYGTSCGALGQSANPSGLRTAHSIVLTGLSPDQTFYFVVDAQDEAGNLTTDTHSGNCYSFTTPDIPIYFTEQFSSSPDLDFTSLEFTPNGSNDFYEACIRTITELPTDPAGGTPITLTDDDYELVSLTGGATVSLYGTAYSEFYICSNGYLTFGASDTDYSETLEDHFDLPRISALFDDLNPATAGTVSWKQLPDRAVVTYAGVPELGSGNPNTFQFELYFDGKIVVSFEEIGVGDCITGLSEGLGLSPGFFATDLSGLTDCDAVTCPGDLDESGVVDMADIMIALTVWRQAGGPADMDSSGIIDVLDYLAMMVVFGPCP